MKNNGGLESSIFATTALVAFAGAGAAAADVTLTGSAEMGIAGGSGTTATTFFQTVDVRFSMSGTTDNGLSFGAVIDLEDARADSTDIAGAFADFTVFVSGDFGRLTMGDTDGAFDWAMDDVNTARNAGSISDAETGHGGYNGNGLFDTGPNAATATTLPNAGGAAYNAQVLRYDYSVAGFGVAVSAQIDQNDARNGDAQFQLGLTYDLDISGGEVQFGLGYVTVADANRTFLNGNVGAAGPIAGDQGYSAVGVSVLAALDAGFSAAVNYTEVNDNGYFGGDGTHTAVGFGYNFDAITVSANWGEYDWSTAAFSVDSEGYGLAASYNLGGGLSAHLGYGKTEITASNGTATARGESSAWSLGLAMSF
ncbi:porin [Roseicyclus marinus]|uniref:Porin n=1 Tax=Roseicyclus marinus TaxID=2161673 RepID=A0AA48KP36_9RHOB|nr:porin [Roseicyclus marinus]